jgi:hypothetical protein
LATFLDGYDVQALGLAIPHMAREFGIAPPAFRFAASGSRVALALAIEQVKLIHEACRPTPAERAPSF